MFKKVAICGKVSLFLGLAFLVISIMTIIQEVKLGTFLLQQSAGVAYLCGAIGMFFFYTIKHLEVKYRGKSSCSIK